MTLTLFCPQQLSVLCSIYLEFVFPLYYQFYREQASRALKDVKERRFLINRHSLTTWERMSGCEQTVSGLHLFDNVMLSLAWRTVVNSNNSLIHENAVEYPYR